MKFTDVISEVGKPICFYPSIANLLGLKETIFLCNILFWSDKGTDDWIYKTTIELEAETGLSRKEQSLAREHLLFAEVMIEKLGQNKILFQLQKDRLNEIWETRKPIQYPVKQKFGDSPKVNPEKKLAIDQRDRGDSPLVNPEQAHHKYVQSTTETLRKKVEEKPKQISFKALEPKPEEILIPKAFEGTKFPDIWREWMECRPKFKKLHFPFRVFNRHMQFLEKLSPEDAIASLNEALAAEYQKPFPPKSRGGGSGNPIMQWKLECEAVTQRIKHHPANRDYIKCSPNPTPEQKAELKSLRAKLENLEASAPIAA